MLDRQKNKELFEKRYKEAEAGNLESQEWLGRAYELAWGVEKDEAKSLEWYQKAARQGHIRAQYVIGKLYEEGKFGLVKNELEAVKWYALGVRQKTDRTNTYAYLQNIHALKDIYKEIKKTPEVIFHVGAGLAFFDAAISNDFNRLAMESANEFDNLLKEQSSEKISWILTSLDADVRTQVINRNQTYLYGLRTQLRSIDNVYLPVELSSIIVNYSEGNSAAILECSSQQWITLLSHTFLTHIENYHAMGPAAGDFYAESTLWYRIKENINQMQSTVTSCNADELLRNLIQGCVSDVRDQLRAPSPLSLDFFSQKKGKSECTLSEKYANSYSAFIRLWKHIEKKLPPAFFVPVVEPAMQTRVIPAQAGIHP